MDFDLNDAILSVYNLTTTAFQQGASSDSSGTTTWQVALQSVCAIVSVCTMSVATCLIYKCRKTFKESVSNNNNNDTMPTILYDPNTGQYMCPPASSHISLPIIANNIPMTMQGTPIPPPARQSQQQQLQPVKSKPKKKKQEEVDTTPKKKHHRHSSKQ